MNNIPNITDILVNTVNKIITQFTDFVPKFITSIVILTVGWLAAKVAATIMKKVLSKLGVDKIGDRINDIDAIRKFNIRVKLSSVIATTVYYFINLIFLIAAADALGVPAISDMVKMLVTFIPKLISAGIMMLAGIFLSDGLRNFVITLCKSFNIAAGKLIGNGIFFFLLIITIIASLGQAGINTSLLESSFNLLVGGIIFAFAIGYGIASKDIMVNIISSFYSKNRYKEGQIIEIDGVKGEIVAMDNTTITIQTSDSKTVFPLQVLQSKKVSIFE